MGYILVIGLIALIVYEIVSTIKVIKKRNKALKEKEQRDKEKLKLFDNKDVVETTTIEEEKKEDVK